MQGPKKRVCFAANQPPGTRHHHRRQADLGPSAELFHGEVRCKRRKFVLVKIIEVDNSLVRKSHPWVLVLEY